MDIIDLTDDFEEETASRRRKDRQDRELETILLGDSSSDKVSSPITQTTVKPTLTPSANPVWTHTNLPKSAPRNSNAKKATGKKSTGKKNRASLYSQWRDGQEFEELESINTPPTVRERKRRQKVAEQKEIGDQIQKLAESVGWKQPHRSDERTTRKNSTATPYLYKQERLAACDICGDRAPIFETMKLKCKHRHCKSCLQQNFLMVIEDPNAWPARCCKPLDQELALNTLSEEEFQRYLDVKREKEQMSSTSCFSCQQAIPSINIIGNSTAFCAKCESVTCVHCTKAMHEGACLLDPETEKLLNMAQGKKWSKCPKCSNMVERNTGCNSMMCRCGVNFCYKCGREMSTCSTRGGCNQIAFQSGMWHNQAPHQPMQTSRKMIEDYRERSLREEAQLEKQRYVMARQNAEAQEKQLVASQIVALRAKLENRAEKDGDSQNSRKKSTPPKPVEKQTLSGIEGYKRAFPALMKALEESNPQKSSAATPPKPSSLVENYQKSFPALIESFVPNSTINQTILSQRQIQAAPPDKTENVQAKEEAFANSLGFDSFFTNYDFGHFDFGNIDPLNLDFSSYF